MPAQKRKRPRGVVDTSVLVAGIAGFKSTGFKSTKTAPKNPSANLLRDWIDGDTFVWLVSDEILLEWLPELRRLFPIYLETNGVLHTALLRLINLIDHISMDIKLPSTSGCTDLWECHKDFLRIAAQKNVFVKIVASDVSEEWEIERACETVAAVDRDIPVILQPVTLRNGSIGISPFRILEFQEIACRFLTEVRIIPQTHKFIGQI